MAPSHKDFAHTCVHVYVYVCVCTHTHTHTHTIQDANNRHSRRPRARHLPPVLNRGNSGDGRVQKPEILELEVLHVQRAKTGALDSLASAAATVKGGGLRTGEDECVRRVYFSVFY